MPWVTVTWSMVAAACLTLAAMHLLIWVKNRRAWGHLLLAASAISAAVVAGFELATMRAVSPEQYAHLVRWAIPPIFVLTAALVLFIRVYLHAGRWWLLWLVVAARALVVVLNFAFSPSLHYAQITQLRHLALPWGESIAVADGVTRPWTVVAQISLLLLILFLTDAMVSVWRRGDHRRAVVVCGSAILFIVLSSVHSSLVVWGVVQGPFFISLAFLCIVVAMGHELSSDVVRAATLASELQAKQAALHDSEQRMDLAARAAGLAMWGWDIRSDRLWMSETGAQLFGLPDLSDLKLDRLLEMLHADERQLLIQSIANSMNGDGDFGNEFRILLSDGRLRWISSRGRVEFDMAGKPLRMHGVAIDITARKQAEQSLRDSEERFRHIVEGAPNAMLMVGIDGRIVLINAQAEAVFGYPRNDLVGQPIEMLIPEEFQQDHPLYRRAYLEDPRPRVMGSGRELFALRKDGTRVPVEIGLNPIVTSGGQFVLASVIDLTARRHAEAEAQQRRAELAHLSRVAMLGELSGSLAHELNQPLAAILSNAEAAQRFMARPNVDLDEVRAILNDIVEDDNRAGEVIRRLRLLLTKGELNRQDLDVNQVIEEVLKLVHSDLVNRGVNVRTELARPLPRVSADRVQLQQVLLNLILNGCDAMSNTESGGRVLSVRTAANDGAGVRVAISDRGHGITADNMDRIFQSFFTTKPHGMGLGLAVCRTLVTAHGGRLWAANNPDHGATFHIELPANSMASG